MCVPETVFFKEHPRINRLIRRLSGEDFVKVTFLFVGLQLDLSFSLRRGDLQSVILPPAAHEAAAKAGSGAEGEAAEAASAIIGIASSASSCSVRRKAFSSCVANINGIGQDLGLGAGLGLTDFTGSCAALNDPPSPRCSMMLMMDLYEESCLQLHEMIESDIMASSELDCGGNAELGSPHLPPLEGMGALDSLDPSWLSDSQGPLNSNDLDSLDVGLMVNPQTGLPSLCKSTLEYYIFLNTARCPRDKQCSRSVADATPEIYLLICRRN